MKHPLTLLTTLLLALFAGISCTLAAENPARTPPLDGAMAMKKFTEIYAPPLIQPNGKGVKPEELAELRRLTARDNPLLATLAREHAKMKKDEFGGFRSLISVPLNEVMQVFTRLGRAYAVASPAEAAEIKAMTCDLCKQLLALGIGEGDMRSAWGLAILDQNYIGLFGMRKELAEAGVLEPMACAIAWWNSPKYLQEKLHEDVGNYGHLFHRIKDCQTFIALAALPDGPDKLRRIQRMQGYLSQLIEGGAIRPTGEMIFHGAFHLAYAYAMPTNLRHISNMKKAGFPISREAQEHLRSYGRAMAHILMEDKLSPNLWMRAGSTGRADRSDDIKQLADMGDPDGSGPVDREMAGLYLAVVGQQPPLPETGPDQMRRKLGNARVVETVQRYRAAGISPAALGGCTPLPARPGLVWRSGDWMISAVGMRPDLGGIEMYGWAAPPCNAYVCNGSVLAMHEGDPRHAVGFAPTNGWDWSLWPAATTLIKRNFELTSRRSLAGAKNNSPVGGVLAVGNGCDAAGLLSMKYQGKDYQGDTLSFCKSIFMFGGRAVVMTSGITSAAPYPCATTLYQEFLEPPASSSGEPPAATSLRSPSGISYTILSSPQADSKLCVLQRHQTWRTPNPATVKPGVKQPPLLKLLGFQQFASLPDPKNVAMDKLLDDFVPCKGNFAVAYFDHGVNPTNAACSFLMSIHGNPETDSVHVKRLDADAHCAYDDVARTWVYASFKPDTVWAAYGLIEHIGRAAALLAREDNHRLRLTLASWEEKNTEAYSVTLRGHWSVTAGPATAKIEADKTILIVPYAGDLSCPVVLKEIP